ncbi:MAG TPA: nicotinamide riboside transporter PnuC [Burkholderiaceae bacterium]|nr:nicotinamide riboside transporter PnuC [Burkholderiaceae bacterium]
MLSLAMVGCSIRVWAAGWPLAMAASLLYALVFEASRLYGEATLQIFFAVVALWGWWQWLRGRADATDGHALRIARLSPRGWALSLGATALLWPATALFLRHATDTDVPWWDGFTTALSVVGQVLLGRKLLENWLAWLVVNLVSVGLFAYKGLWLTVVLYALFAALSVAGWRAWHARLLTAR